MTKNNDLNTLINADSINYEVALEILGQSFQKLRNAIKAEQAKNKPSDAVIDYYQNRLKGLQDLQDDLPNDPDIVNQILDPENKMFRL